MLRLMGQKEFIRLVSVLSTGRYLAAAFCMALCLTLSNCAQAQVPATPAGTPLSWVQAAADNEIHIINEDGSPVRYRVRKIDAKGDTTREIIETRQGNVARLIQRNSQPIAPEEDVAERARLQTILDSPEDFLRHHKHDESNREYSRDLVRLLPQAMIHSYAPGQPQIPGPLQVVIDYHPDPNFNPPTTISKALTGIEGRAWIDAKSKRVMRIEGHIIKPVSFGWFGMLGSINEGGTLILEQINAGNDRWAYSRLDEHLTTRVVWKSVPVNDKMTASDFHLLPAPMSFQEATRELLSEAIPLHCPNGSIASKCAAAQ